MPFLTLQRKQVRYSYVVTDRYECDPFMVCGLSKAIVEKYVILSPNNIFLCRFYIKYRSTISTSIVNEVRLFELAIFPPLYSRIPLLKVEKISSSLREFDPLYLQRINPTEPAPMAIYNLH
jgi:hypothetical protein